MGHSFSALLGTLGAGHWKVSPGNWFGCGFDLAFASFNSTLGLTQKLVCGGKIRRAELTTQPVFILGHWRTGTTWLHELLALDPRHRAPTTYECFCPNHAFLTYDWLTSWTGFTLPSKRPPDAMPVGWHLPQEDEFGLLNLGVPSIYRGVAFPNQPWPDQKSLELDALSPAERERWLNRWRWFLRTVLARREGRLILKSPQHTFRVPHLLQSFPRARFIYLVRNPLSVIPSTIRLWKTLSSVHGYGGKMRNTLEEEVLAMFARMHQRVEATKGDVPADRWQVVRYEDFVQDPVTRLRDIYEQLSLDDFSVAEPIVREAVAKRKSYKTNKHTLDERLKQRIEEVCGPYAKQYGYW